MMVKWLATVFLVILIFGTAHGINQDDGRQYGTLSFGLLGFFVTLVAVWS